MKPVHETDTAMVPSPLVRLVAWPLPAQWVCCQSSPGAVSSEENKKMWHEGADTLPPHLTFTQTNSAKSIYRADVSVSQRHKWSEIHLTLRRYQSQKKTFLRDFQEAAISLILMALKFLNVLYVLRTVRPDCGRWFGGVIVVGKLAKPNVSFGNITHTSSTCVPAKCVRFQGLGELGLLIRHQHNMTLTNSITKGTSRQFHT